MSANNHAHHILPLRLYLGVGGALLFLTIVTVWVAQFDLGAFNMAVAMIIAGVKATLVALFFMHLKYDNKLYMIVFVGALVFLTIFIIFTMFDTENRGDIYRERGMEVRQKALMYNQADSTAVVAPADSVAATAGDTASHQSNGH